LQQPVSYEQILRLEHASGLQFSAVPTGCTTRTHAEDDSVPVYPGL